MFFYGQSWLVYAIWMFLLGASGFAMWEQNWPMVFVALATLFSSIVPAMVADRYEIRLPVAFFAGMVLFIFAALFLGEAFDFYERYWWWDIALHGAAAMGFGLVGVIIALVMFEGDRYAAPAWAISLFAFCLSVTIGAMWEVFEYLMDLSFGLNMQKSGLMDTMSDLMVDAIGGAIGAVAGLGYLHGRDKHGLAGQIGEFVRRNRGIFRKAPRED